MRRRHDLTESLQVVLVTGGTGFVAGWCIVALLQRGYQVRTTLRDLSKERQCGRPSHPAPAPPIS